MKKGRRGRGKIKKGGRKRRRKGVAREEGRDREREGKRKPTL